VNVIDPRLEDKFKVCKLGKVNICISVSAVQNNWIMVPLRRLSVAFGTTNGSGTVEGQAVRTVGEEAMISAVQASIPILLQATLPSAFRTICSNALLPSLMRQAAR
jgi:hypothetical protein